MTAALGDARTMALWAADEGPQAPAAVFNAGPFSLAKFVNGRVAGNVFADSAGVLEVIQENLPGLGGLLFTVPQDATMPFFQYPFTIQVFAPYVTIRWTQGGGASTFLRASVTALPQ